MSTIQLAIQTTRQYRSLVLLLAPAVLFGVFLCLYMDHPRLDFGGTISDLPWQFYVIAIFGIIATVGGVLDWRYHQNPLNMEIPLKEWNTEATKLGIFGVLMFFLMWFAMISENPKIFLVPILFECMFTMVAISSNKYAFHLKHFGSLEDIYNQMLVFGNGIAWLAWFHFIYMR